jgi:response regulator NasT
MSQMKVVIVEDDPITRLDIKELLSEEGIVTIGECGDGLSGVELVRKLKPDLAIMDIKMPVMDGIEAAKILNEDKVAPVLLLTAFSQTDLIEEAKKAGVLAYLVKPINKQNLIPACQIAVSRYREFEVLRGEVNNMQDAVETRKLLEKAKVLLESKYGLDEESAFKRIKQISESQKKPMKEVVEAIIMTLS